MATLKWFKPETYWQQNNTERVSKQDAEEMTKRMRDFGCKSKTVRRRHEYKHDKDDYGPHMGWQYGTTYQRPNDGQHGVKLNPKRIPQSHYNAPLLPAKVRINPRTGKVQVFVSPKVAAQVKGNRRNPWFSRTKDAIKGNRYMVLDTDKVPVHAGILTKKQALEVAKEARQAGEKVRLVKAK